MDYASAKRFLVFFLYLKDNEGGHTSFPDEMKVKNGIIKFPPMWNYKHMT